jgi:hypothetical protein
MQLRTGTASQHTISQGKTLYNWARFQRGCSQLTARRVERRKRPVDIEFYCPVCEAWTVNGICAVSDQVALGMAAD